MSTEEVAGLIGTTPQYVKQLRHYKTGPKFYATGGMTALGFRQIVYRSEDVKDWQKDTVEFSSDSGRTWRFNKGKLAKLKENAGKPRPKPKAA